MNFLSALKQTLNLTNTQNGAIALKSTDSSLVDLFGTIGSLRGKSNTDIEIQFGQAFAEDRLLAMKILFYARDVRGGLGERRVARILYKHLAMLYPEVLRKNLDLISHFGRWDDLLILLDTSLCKDVVAIIARQLQSDMDAEFPSLLAKWLPSVNTTSSETRRQAQIVINGLKWSAVQYRKTLSTLRKKLDVLEVKMTQNEWDQVAYSRVPSNAMNLYSRAFMGHDEERFNAYIKAVQAGEEKIQASVLYPYNITEKILYGKHKDQQAVLEQQWRHLPDYVSGLERNILVMADVSGSMTGRPMATSIGLALYFAQRCSGPFANHFMTFSESPSLVKVTGDSLYEQVTHALGSNWGMNTDFEKALLSILKTAVAARASQLEMPQTLIVVTDMQFDASLTSSQKQWTFYKTMKHQYNNAGYQIPEIVFWNVNCESNVFQASAHYAGVKIASGQSASVFKSILDSKALTSYDFMLEVLESPRYQGIAV